MQIVAMDGVRLTILMIAGGLFSMAGILLMFRAKQEGSSARLELFGQKFEAASTGIIVFLIGAAFLAAPMYVPERARAVIPKAPTTPGQDLVSSLPGGAPLLPKPVDKDEAEENNSISEATVVEMGQTVRGEARPGDLDWYAVAVDPKSRHDMRVVFRPKGGICPRYTILDGAEKVVRSTQVCEISDTTDVPIEADHYFVQIDAGNRPISYELAFAYKP